MRQSDDNLSFFLSDLACFWMPKGFSFSSSPFIFQDDVAILVFLGYLSFLPSFILFSLPSHLFSPYHPPSLPSFSFLFIAHSMPFQYIVSNDFHFRKLFLNFNFQYLFLSTSLVSVFKQEGELLLYICCFFFFLTYLLYLPFSFESFLSLYFLLIEKNSCHFAFTL